MSVCEPYRIPDAVDALHTHQDRFALTDLSEIGSGRSVHFTELATRMRRAASALRSLGIQRGDAVATLLPNCIEWVDVFLGSAWLGALVVPLNTRYRTHELGHLLRLSGARVLVTAADFEGVNFAERLAEVAELSGEEKVPVEHVIDVGGDGTNFASAWQSHPGSVLSDQEPIDGPSAAAIDDPLIVFGTSGTTSAPKLAVHTHATASVHATRTFDRMQLGHGGGSLQVLSTSGVFGFVPFLASLFGGNPTVLLPIFKRERVLQALQEHPAELLVAAEGSLRDLLDVVTLQTRGSLRRMVTAGIAIEDIVDAADHIEVEARNVYGSSEVWAFAGTSPTAADREERILPGGDLVDDELEVRVVDMETEREAAPGQVGELRFRGATLFRHYLNNSEATAKAFDEEGWFRTGDAAEMITPRTFRYLARANDTLRLGGYSVSPADVETAIEEMVGVRQAQVVGVRDTRSGDDLGVAFVLADGSAPLHEQSVLDHCRGKMASFKVPKKVVILDQYPTTPSANGDKVQRNRLRTMAEELMGNEAIAVGTTKEKV